MAELYPSDSELNALSGTSDSEQGVLYVATGESPYYTSFYKMLYRLLKVARRAGDLRVYKDGALTFGVRAGKYLDGVTVRTYAGATGQALTNNQTNYIYLTPAGTLTVNTTGFPDMAVTPHVPLASIVTSAGSYEDASITDYRGRAIYSARPGFSKVGDSYVIVHRGTTDAEAGTNLLAAYAAAKALTPGGNALSATNRATVLLPPGRYSLTPQTGAGAMVLDTSFVDLAGFPAGRPDSTVVTSAGGSGKGATVAQTANDVRLTGLAIENTGQSDGNHGLLVNATDNTSSRYSRLHLRQSHAGVPGLWSPVFFASSNAGTWEDCEADDFAWRLASGKTLGGVMRRCIAGEYSFGGDGENTGLGGLTGTFEGCTGGDYCFGGCGSMGLNCSGTFRDCLAGAKSFAMGKTFSGTARRCVGGDHCFGGYYGSGTCYGTFSGYAEDCVASGRSFGSGHGSCVCSGRLVRCRCTGMPAPMYLTGAKIEDCLLETTGTDQHCLVLNDGNSRAYGSTLIANGTGKSLYATAAKNVLALHCRCNADKDANVTNLVGDGSLAAGCCVVDSDVAA